MPLNAKQTAAAWRRLTRALAFKLPGASEELRKQERRVRRLVPPGARRSRTGR